MLRRALATTLRAGLLFCVGCGDLFSACVKADYDDEEEELLAVHAPAAVLVNGTEAFTVSDGCTAAENPTCEDDTAIGVDSSTVTGALASATPMGTFTAGPLPGSGELRVYGTSAEGTTLLGSTVVDVVFPDGANVEPLCDAGGVASAPFPVPRASTLRIAWTFTLEGEERSGFTGEIPVDAPDLTLVESNNQNVAVYATPNAVVGELPVASTLSDARFDLETYDPSEVALDVEALPATGTSQLAFRVKQTFPALGGRPPCMNPALALTALTPEVCHFGTVAAAPTLTLVPANDGTFLVLAVAAGTCQIGVVVDGTSVEETLVVEVVPGP